MFSLCPLAVYRIKSILKAWQSFPLAITKFLNLTPMVNRLNLVTAVPRYGFSFFSIASTFDSILLMRFETSRYTIYPKISIIAVYTIMR